MATQLRIKRGTTNANAPSGLTAGELATLVSTMVDIPIIGIPTSVGYGYGVLGNLITKSKDTLEMEILPLETNFMELNYE